MDADATLVVPLDCPQELWHPCPEHRLAGHCRQSGDVRRSSSPAMTLAFLGRQRALCAA